MNPFASLFPNDPDSDDTNDATLDALPQSAQDAIAAAPDSPMAKALNSKYANSVAVHNMLVNELGANDTAARGFVGGLQGESGVSLDPSAVAPGDGADGSDSIGIYQANGARADALKAIAAKMGIAPTDIAANIAGIKAELQSPQYAGILKQLQDGSSLSDGVNANVAYEGPADKAAAYNKRIGLASSYSNALDNGSASLPDGTSAFASPDGTAPAQGAISTLLQGRSAATGTPTTDDSDTPAASDLWSQFKTGGPGALIGMPTANWSLGNTLGGLSLALGARDNPTIAGKFGDWLGKANVDPNAPVDGDWVKVGVTANGNIISQNKKDGTTKTSAPISGLTDVASARLALAQAKAAQMGLTNVKYSNDGMYVTGVNKAGQPVTLPVPQPGGAPAPQAAPAPAPIAPGAAPGAPAGFGSAQPPMAHGTAPNSVPDGVGLNGVTPTAVNTNYGPQLPDGPPMPPSMGGPAPQTAPALTPLDRAFVPNYAGIQAPQPVADAPVSAFGKPVTPVRKTEAAINSAQKTLTEQQTQANNAARIVSGAQEAMEIVQQPGFNPSWTQQQLETARNAFDASSPNGQDLKKVSTVIQQAGDYVASLQKGSPSDQRMASAMKELLPGGAQYSSATIGQTMGRIQSILGQNYVTNVQSMNRIYQQNPDFANLPSMNAPGASEYQYYNGQGAKMAYIAANAEGAANQFAATRNAAAAAPAPLGSNQTKFGAPGAPSPAPTPAPAPIAPTIVHALTPAAVSNLTPGTRFVGQDGKLRMVPWTATPNNGIDLNDSIGKD